MACYSRPLLSICTGCRDETGLLCFDLKLSLCFNVCRPVLQPAPAVDIKTCTFLLAYTTNTLRLTLIPVFPAAECAIYPHVALPFFFFYLHPALSEALFPDSLLYFRAHARAQKPCSCPFRACGGLHSSFMDQCSVNLGQGEKKKKREAHGNGMPCAITANDMPPCKLWP